MFGLTDPSPLEGETATLHRVTHMLPGHGALEGGQNLPDRLLVRGVVVLVGLVDPTHQGAKFRDELLVHTVADRRFHDVLDVGQVACARLLVALVHLGEPVGDRLHDVGDPLQVHVEGQVPGRSEAALDHIHDVGELTLGLAGLALEVATKLVVVGKNLLHEGNRIPVGVPRHLAKDLVLKLAPLVRLLDSLAKHARDGPDRPRDQLVHRHGFLHGHCFGVLARHKQLLVFGSPKVGDKPTPSSVQVAPKYRISLPPIPRIMLAKLVTSVLGGLFKEIGAAGLSLRRGLQMQNAELNPEIFANLPVSMTHGAARHVNVQFGRTLVAELQGVHVSCSSTKAHPHSPKEELVARALAISEAVYRSSITDAPASWLSLLLQSVQFLVTDLEVSLDDFAVLRLEEVRIQPSTVKDRGASITLRGLSVDVLRSPLLRADNFTLEPWNMGTSPDFADPQEGSVQVSLSTEQAVAIQGALHRMQRSKDEIERLLQSVDPSRVPRRIDGQMLGSLVGIVHARASEDGISFSEACKRESSAKNNIPLLLAGVLRAEGEALFEASLKAAIPRDTATQATPSGWSFRLPINLHVVLGGLLDLRTSCLLGGSLDSLGGQVVTLRCGNLVSTLNQLVFLEPVDPTQSILEITASRSPEATRVGVTCGTPLKIHLNRPNVLALSAFLSSLALSSELSREEAPTGPLEWNVNFQAPTVVLPLEGGGGSLHLNLGRLSMSAGRFLVSGVDCRYVDTTTTSTSTSTPFFQCSDWEVVGSAFRAGLVQVDVSPQNLDRLLSTLDQWGQGGAGKVSWSVGIGSLRVNLHGQEQVHPVTELTMTNLELGEAGFRFQRAVCKDPSGVDVLSCEAVSQHREAHRTVVRVGQAGVVSTQGLVSTLTPYWRVLSGRGGGGASDVVVSCPHLSLSVEGDTIVASNVELGSTGAETQVSMGTLVVSRDLSTSMNLQRPSLLFKPGGIVVDLGRSSLFVTEERAMEILRYITDHSSMWTQLFESERPEEPTAKVVSVDARQGLLVSLEGLEVSCSSLEAGFEIGRPETTRLRCVGLSATLHGVRLLETPIRFGWSNGRLELEDRLSVVTTQQQLLSASNLLLRFLGKEAVRVDPTHLEFSETSDEDTPTHPVLAHETQAAPSESTGASTLSTLLALRGIWIRLDGWLVSLEELSLVDGRFSCQARLSYQGFQIMYSTTFTATYNAGWVVCVQQGVDLNLTPLVWSAMQNLPVAELKGVSDAWTQSATQSTQAFRVEFKTPRMRAWLFSNEPGRDGSEFALTMTHPQLSFLESGWSVKVERLQLDNFTYTPFPVVFAPFLEFVARQEVLRTLGQPVTPHVSMFYADGSLSIAIAPSHVGLDTRTLNRLLDFFSPEGVVIASPPVVWSLREIRILPLCMSLSCESTSRRVPGSGAFWTRVASGLLTLDEAWLRIPSFRALEVRASMAEIFLSFLSHMVDSVLKTQKLSTLAAMPITGSLLRSGSHVGNGAISVLNTPMEHMSSRGLAGLITGATGAATEVVGHTASAVSHLLGGVPRSIQNGIGGVAGVTSVSFRQTFQAARHDGGTGALESAVVTSVTALGRTLKATGGLVMSPIEGARTGGLSGFVGGAVRGVAKLGALAAMTAVSAPVSLVQGVVGSVGDAAMAIRDLVDVDRANIYGDCPVAKTSDQRTINAHFSPPRYLSL